jgi:hypothetical protein
MNMFENPGLTGVPYSRRAAVKKTRVPGTGSQMQFPGMEDFGPAATKTSPHSVPKRRAMGGTSARISNQPFLPGFNPRNAPGSAMDMKRTVMTPKRQAGIDAARARSAALKKLPGADNIPGPKNPRFSRKTLLGMGLGLGVAAGVAMNRRGEGASSGRQSMYKY